MHAGPSQVTDLTEKANFWECVLKTFFNAGTSFVTDLATSG